MLPDISFKRIRVDRSRTNVFWPVSIAVAMLLSTRWAISRRLRIIDNMMYGAARPQVSEYRLQVFVAQVADCDPRHYRAQLSRSYMSCSQRLNEQALVVIRQN